MSIEREHHEFYMQLALRLGEMGRKSAPPNPWVGCVVVKNGNVVGRGYHAAPGMPHAETLALKEAGEKAVDAAAYVTLEPCAHHGRTPPCVDSIIRSGLRHVVIPFLDPDPRVSGRGVQALKQAGINVIAGVCAEEATRSLAPYLHHRQTGLPYVVLKAAVSLDGKMAANDGTSQWITGEEARKDVQNMRAQSQAILVGARTAHIDRPRLTVREGDYLASPLRVVVDAKGILHPDGPLFDPSLGKTLIFTTVETPLGVRNGWERKGCEVIVADAAQEGVDLKFLCRELGQRGVLQLLVEGGGILLKSFIDQKLFQKLSLYYGSCFIGEKGQPLYKNNEATTLSESLKLHLDGVSRFGDDLRLDYLPSNRLTLAPTFGP